MNLINEIVAREYVAREMSLRKDFVMAERLEQLLAEYRAENPGPYLTGSTNHRVIQILFRAIDDLTT